MRNTRICYLSWFQKFPSALLLLIPIALIYLGFQLRSAGGHFSLFATDPEFIFLFSGLAITIGHIDLFTVQPGTPIQVLEGFIARIIHLFRPGTSFPDDVLQHPDLYLHIVSICIILLVAAGVFLAGYILYRRTGNLPATLFLQFAPFVAEQVFATLERAMIEPLFIPFFALFFAYLWLDAMHQLPSYGLAARRVWIYAIMAGLGLSMKFNFVSFLLIPLFMLRNWKERTSYAFLTTGFFYLFTFPLFIKTRNFYQWIKSLVLHSGVYGTGDNNVVDISQFLSHLNTMVHEKKFLFAAILVGTLIFLTSYLPSLRKKMKGNPLPSLLAGLLLAQILGILIIAKHYSERYLIPELLMVVPLLFVCIQMFIRMIPERFGRVDYILYALIVYLLAIHPQTFRQHRMYLPLKKKIFEAKLESIRYLRQFPTPDALLLSSDNWSICPEYGLFFGMLMTPNGRNIFGSYLNKIYPNTYLFKEYDGRFFDWFDQPHPAGELLSQYRTAILVANRYNKKIYEQLENLFSTIPETEITLAYKNEQTNTRIYLIRNHQNHSKLLANQR